MSVMQMPNDHGVLELRIWRQVQPVAETSFVQIVVFYGVGVTAG